MRRLALIVNDNEDRELIAEEASSPSCLHL